MIVQNLVPVIDPRTPMLSAKIAAKDQALGIRIADRHQKNIVIEILMLSVSTLATLALLGVRHRPFSPFPEFVLLPYKGE